MKAVKYLILGAGITGLTVAERFTDSDYLILEKEEQPGGYCKSIVKDTYVWDYAGHFFHFKDEKELDLFAEKLGEGQYFKVKKNSKIYYNETYMSYPFQLHINQLNHTEFTECMDGLRNRVRKEEYTSFLEMLYCVYGKGIVDKFLKPYNEKLYACDLDELDSYAMGRFFPYVNEKEILKTINKQEDYRSYNDFFYYPVGGVEKYIETLNYDREKLLVGCEIRKISFDTKTVYTNKGNFRYEKLISTIPLNQLCLLGDKMFDMEWSWNQVLVINIGFDKKTNIKDFHWVYVPDKTINFYRVGFYDNIASYEKGSLYVEIAFPKDVDINVDEEYKKALQGLHKMGIIGKQKVVSYDFKIMNPAYVHIKNKCKVKKILESFNNQEVYSIGRYGAWKYCSMEDCILEAKNTVSIL